MGNACVARKEVDVTWLLRHAAQIEADSQDIQLACTAMIEVDS